MWKTFETRLGFVVFSFAEENLDGLLALLSSCFTYKSKYIVFAFCFGNKLFLNSNKN
jgi:hypothetical protein